MSIDWKVFKAVVEKHTNILLTSHIRPDCDALGSELGMAGVLTALGKKVRIVNGQSTPPNLKFIDPHNQIMAINEDVKLDELGDVDLVMILDTSAWAQLGPMKEFLNTTSAKKIILDHHVGEDDLGAELFKNTIAEATGRLVVEAAEVLDVKLTPEIATPLFAAISTDTGWFRYPSTTSLTYRVAAGLVDAGASPAGIFQDLYERETIGRMRLKGLVLSRLECELDGRFVHTYVVEQDFTDSGALHSETEDLVNMSLEIAGTLFAVILIEQPNGGFKISFRSRCPVACNEVAAEFGGGGHKAAAGAFVKGILADVQPKVLDHVRKTLYEAFA
jgi:bifunctional oligoribonuclease and PAP phosphatase NrnA